MSEILESKKQKIIVVLGPTAVGKSDIAVRIAKRFGGEVVSADSRQVYKGLDIGTGKITKREMQGVPHYLLDVADPKRVFTAAEFQKQALQAIGEIHARGKLPILCGGTGFYIQSVVDGITYPEVKPNKKLRKELSAKTVSELATLLKKLDPRRFKEIDQKNPARLIRAIEIAQALGKVPKVKITSPFDSLQIGIRLDDEILKNKIHTRLLKRLKSGMLREAKRLHKEGLSWKRMEELGLEYKYMALHLQGKISKEEMIEELNKEIWHYAKRQATWFKKDRRIRWVEASEIAKIEKEVGSFLDI